MNSEIEAIKSMDEEQLEIKSKEYRVPVELVKKTRDLGRLPVVNFAAGGIATPADAALMMQLGCDGVFVGSGIFKSSNPETLAKAIVEATTHYNNPKILAEVSEGIGEPMQGLEIKNIDTKMADRGN
jgi:pyridoxal 5'-phosphate synthase pdxS subunit